MTQGTTKKPLSPKNAKFVEEFLIHFNATRAAIAAGYSKKTAYASGHRLLRKAEIVKALEKGRARHLKKADLEPMRVLEEIRRVAFSDVRTVFDADGNLRPIHELSDEDAAAISSVEVTRQRRDRGKGRDVDIDETLHKVKLWDKMKGLDLAARHFKLLTDRLEVHDADALMERLAAGRERVRAARAKP